MANISCRITQLLSNNPLTERRNIQAVKDATVEFATRVTTTIPTKTCEEQAALIDECFDNDARLRGTVSQVIRKKTSEPTIKDYFSRYFSQCNIPSLKITNTNFNIRKLAPNLYENLAYVQFSSNEDGIAKQVTAEMSFIFRKNCSGKWLITLLDSNPIYEKVPDELRPEDVFTLWSLKNDTREITDEKVFVFQGPFRQ